MVIPQKQFSVEFVCFTTKAILSRRSLRRCFHNKILLQFCTSGNTNIDFQKINTTPPIKTILSTKSFYNVDTSVFMGADLDAKTDIHLSRFETNKSVSVFASRSAPTKTFLSRAQDCFCGETSVFASRSAHLYRALILNRSWSSSRTKTMHSHKANIDPVRSNGF